MSRTVKVLFAIGVPCSLLLAAGSFNSACRAGVNETEGRFTVLNPEAWYAPFQAHPLLPRFDSLEGRVIGIAGEHEPLLYLKEELEQAVPGLKAVYLTGEEDSLHPLEGFSRYADEQNPYGFTAPVLQKIKETRIDSLIRGIAH